MNKNEEIKVEEEFRKISEFINKTYGFTIHYDLYDYKSSSYRVILYISAINRNGITYSYNPDTWKMEMQSNKISLKLDVPVIAGVIEGYLAVIHTISAKLTKLCQSYKRLIRFIENYSRYEESVVKSEAYIRSKLEGVEVRHEWKADINAVYVLIYTTYKSNTVRSRSSKFPINQKGMESLSYRINRKYRSLGLIPDKK